MVRGVIGCSGPAPSNAMRASAATGPRPRPRRRRARALRRGRPAAGFALRRGRTATRPSRAPPPPMRSGRARWPPPVPSRQGFPWTGRSGGGRSPPSGRSHSRASMPEVATPPARTRSVCATPPVNGWRTRTSHGAPRPATTRRSPPQSTTQRPWRSSRSATKSAAHPFTEPPRSSSRPGGRRITPASSSTSTARHSAAGCGRAGRRGRAESSARCSDDGSTCARDSP